MGIDNISKQLRPEIIELEQYKLSRDMEGFETGSMVFLDANEAPFEAYEGAPELNQYVEQQPPEMLESLKSLYGADVENILATRGSEEGINVLIRAICTPAKDNIVVCPPTFSLYEYYASIHSVEVKESPLDKDFDLNIERITKVADENARAVFLCSPNNPTGGCIDENRIIELCTYFQNTAFVIVDEAYVGCSKNGSIVSLVQDFDNLVVLRSLSKSYAAAGLRLGL